MKAFLGIVILCCIPALVALGVQYLGDRKSKEKFDYLKSYVFWLFSFYGLLSGIKFILGERDISLIKSFADILPQTYLHYGIPLVVISVICPWLIKIILRRKSQYFIAFFDSIVFCVLFLFYLITGRMSNMEYVTIFILGGIISFLACFVYKGIIDYCNTKKEMKERIRYSLPIMLLHVITVLLYIPNELFMSNVKEFQFTYSSFLLVLVIGSITLVMVGLFGGIFLASKKQYEIIFFLIFSCTFIGYLQGNILNGTLAVLDGTKQTWANGTKVINSFIWFAAIGGLGILLTIYKKRAKKIISLICLYITLIQVVSLIFLVLTTDLSKEEEYALTTEAMLELDEENNVIVFVLDWFDGQIMEKVVAEDADFLEPLNDFTWYQNATSCYAFTDMSLPYLLTGVKWEYDMLEEEYCRYAYQNSDFLQTIDRMQYDLGVYTEKVVVDSSVKDILLNYENVMERKCSFGDTIYMMQKCSKYKMAPFALKEMYWYATSDISSLLGNDNVYVTYADMPFHDKLVKERISIRNDNTKNGAFRFYHLFGAHLPYVMSEDMTFSENATMLGQARGCLKILYEYLEQMKALGIYDEATIIITADHGQNTYLSDGENAQKAGFEMTSNPILFVKKSGESGKSDMEISMAPVSHEEFRPTVLEAIGLDGLTYGRTFEQISENEERSRTFIFGRHHDFSFVKYVINGNVRDIQSWMKLSLP